MIPQTIYSVYTLTMYIRQMFDLDYRMQDVWVEGEVSNFSQPASGHWYFTLKDDRSQLRAVMWKSNVAFQRYAPAPFYAFDEVDMMLDGFNAERLAKMVKEHSAHAQFVVVSLRRPMIENADHKIGVSLRADGYSRVVGITEIQLPPEPQQAVGA